VSGGLVAGGLMSGPLGAETRPKTNLVLSKAEKDTGGNHFEYSDVHVLQ